MVSNTRVDTLNMFSDLAKAEPFEDKQAIPISIVLPAFITSELKTAFEIGFLIFLPFLVIRHGNSFHFDVFGYDDAVANAYFSPLQTLTFCFS